MFKMSDAVFKLLYQNFSDSMIKFAKGFDLSIVRKHEVVDVPSKTEDGWVVKEPSGNKDITISGNNCELTLSFRLKNKK